MNTAARSHASSLLEQLSFRKLDQEAHARLCDELESLTGVQFKPVTDAGSPVEEFVGRFPIRLAREWNILALEPAQDGFPVEVHVADPASLDHVDQIGRFLKRSVIAVFSTEDQIRNAINDAFENRSSQTRSTIKSLSVDENVIEISSEDRQDLLDLHGNPPVIRLVNSILFDAVMDRASDVHIQPFEERLQVRFRIDGVLFDQFEIPRASQEAVISRIKIIGRMNIAEKRLPQDGRATAVVGDRRIDLRISSVPASHGERIVVRLLDKSARLYTLDQLGMQEKDLAEFQRLIRLEHGLILVTGPTGGGKSTTLYAALSEINSNARNVVTLEDPVEYQLEGISQIQISDKKGMTFASGLRHVLRQDPDIIMVGEIRDEETADMAIKSALTGHMVFSTLHTNDAPTTITRLLDLDIEPFLVSSSLVGVLSQRLVRRICSACCTADTVVSEELLEQLGTPYLSPFESMRGAGCAKCRGTGFRGRVGVFELMSIRQSIKKLIQCRANAGEIREAALEGGMRTLAHDGLAKVASGLTTLDEIRRISAQLEY
ncbi:MAG: ATPase, T2SS/T4P/T4SS family [Planctomycetota bacterium]